MSRHPLAQRLVKGMGRILADFARFGYKLYPS